MSFLEFFQAELLVKDENRQTATAAGMILTPVFPQLFDDAMSGRAPSRLTLQQPRPQQGVDLVTTCWPQFQKQEVTSLNDRHTYLLVGSVQLLMSLKGISLSVVIHHWS